MNSFRGASAHYFLVQFLLKPVAELYLKNNKAKDYIIELVQLDVKSLLTVEPNNEEDIKVVEEFTKFLKDCVVQHNGVTLTKPETFKQIKVSIMLIVEKL